MISTGRLDLSILIVSWNVRDPLAACLDSIAAAPLRLVPGPTPSAVPERSVSLTAEVIVVDSASSDGTPNLLRERYPWVRLVAARENIGFTRGNNCALEMAQGRYLLMLNPDTVVHGDALNGLVNHLETHPNVGIAGPRVLNADGSTQSTRRRFPTPTTAFFESTWLQARTPRRVLSHYYVTDKSDHGTFDVDWVQGCALVARRAVYEQIGGLDTGYVMYSEELDWCRRAKAKGWRVSYVGSAEITHYGGMSSGQVEANKHIYFQQSKIRYFSKYHGPRFARVLRVYLMLSYAFQVLLESGKALLASKPRMRWGRIRVYLRVILALARG